MDRKDAGVDAQQRCARLRGRSEPPPGAARIRAYVRGRPPGDYHPPASCTDLTISITRATTMYEPSASITACFAGDHRGRDSSVDGGIVHCSLGTSGACPTTVTAPASLRERRAARPASARTTASTAPPAVASAVTSTPGTSVVTVRITDSRISTPTTTLENAFSHGGLTHGPRTSRSLQSINRNSVVIGSRIPHRAWTASVMTPRGALGISTTPAATRISAPNIV